MSDGALRYDTALVFARIKWLENHIQGSTCRMGKNDRQAEQALKATILARGHNSKGLARRDELSCHDECGGTATVYVDMISI